MPRRHLHPAAVVGMIAIVLIIIAGGPILTGAWQAVPTPRGQLGGAVPLATESAVPSDERIAGSEPAACDHEPVSIDELLAASVATPPASTDHWDAAAPASEQQIEAARALIAELLACANANDPGRAYALYTPDGLARALARSRINPQAVEFILETRGEPLPGVAQASLISLDNVRAADDDHLRAEVILVERSGFGELQQQAYVVDLALIDNVWLIDDIRQV